MVARIQYAERYAQYILELVEAYRVTEDAETQQNLLDELDGLTQYDEEETA